MGTKDLMEVIRRVDELRALRRKAKRCGCRAKNCRVCEAGKLIEEAMKEEPAQRKPDEPNEEVRAENEECAKLVDKRTRKAYREGNVYVGKMCEEAAEEIRDRMKSRGETEATEPHDEDVGK